MFARRGWTYLLVACLFSGSFHCLEHAVEGLQRHRWAITQPASQSPLLPAAPDSCGNETGCLCKGALLTPPTEFVAPPLLDFGSALLFETAPVLSLAEIPALLLPHPPDALPISAGKLRAQHACWRL